MKRTILRMEGQFGGNIVRGHENPIVYYVSTNPIRSVSLASLRRYTETERNSPKPLLAEYLVETLCIAPAFLRYVHLT